MSRVVQQARRLRRVATRHDGILNAILYAADPEKSLWASNVDKGPSP